MRPITNFMLHAAAATVLTAFAAGQYMSLGDSTPAASSVQRGKEKWIEIQGWDWGAPGTAGTGNSVGASRRSTGDPDRPVIAGNVPNPAAAKRQHGQVTITKEWDAATPRLATPLAKGSVWIRVATPWTACRVGARYPSLELGDGGGKKYLLQDVTVARCGRSGDADDRPTEEVAFYYNRIAFKYAR